MGAEDFPSFIEQMTAYGADVVFLQEADNLPYDIPCKGYVVFKTEGEGRTMLLLRGTLSSFVKFSILEATHTIVIFDKIVLASVYLPNSMHSDDLYDACVSTVQSNILLCFNKGAKCVVGGGDLNFKCEPNIKHYSGECCVPLTSSSSANLPRDITIRAFMKRIGCQLTSTFNNHSESFETYKS